MPEMVALASGCPHVVISDEGTAYCALAESQGAEAARLEVEVDELKIMLREAAEMLGPPLSCSAELLEAPRPTSCPSCAAPVIFATTANGDSMTLDAAPYLGGNVRLIDGWRAEVVGPLEAMDVELYGSHFARCPQAKEWRRRR